MNTYFDILTVATILALALAALSWSGVVHRKLARHSLSVQRRQQCHQRVGQVAYSSENYFRDIAEAASDWIWEMDAELRVTYVSEQFYTLTGIAPEHVLGRRRWELVSKDDENAENEKWRQHRQTLEQRQAFRDFTYCTRLNDSVRYFKVSGKPIYDAEGGFCGYRGMGTDITEQTNAEIALQESRRTLATLISNLPGMAYRCRSDAQWTAEFISDGAYDLLGYRPQDLLGNRHISYTDLIHPDDRKRLWNAVQQTLREHKHYQVVYRITTAQGEEKWVWEQGCGVFSAHGELIAFEGFITDITEQKRAEQAANRMRVYLRNIIDAIDSVLVVVDEKGNITEWNRAAERRIRKTRAEVLGKPCIEAYPVLATQWQLIQQTLHQSSVSEPQRIKHETQNTVRYDDVVICPLRKDGIKAAVIKIDDVTAQVRIQEVMVQTEKMMSIGGLAAGMAHEINNPLGMILQSVQTIQRRLAAELPKNRQTAEALGLDFEQLERYLVEREIARFLKDIREAGQRAAKIIEDMLTFSRRSTFVFDYAEVGEMLETALRLAANDYELRKHFDFKNIHIEREYDPALDTVYCDKTEIEQVILNLIKNAAQALTKAALPNPVITLRTRCEPEYACIEVCDNGIGMDEAVRKRVFEPFFTTKEVGMGTGLGLSVSYFIINEQHKGNLTVQSEPGKGACFTIRLPRKE